MKLLISQSPSRQALRGMERLLIVCGVSLLSYCAYVLTDTWVFQTRQQREFEQLLNERQAAIGAIGREAPPEVPLIPQPAVGEGLIGRIEIKRIGISAIVMEGTNRITLRRAVGHIAGTALPGTAGNIGLSGHRDSFFAPLREIRKNDIITLTTTNGEFRYRVVSTGVVPQTDVSVLDPDESEVLTLVTCFPFSYVGPAPERFIVRAERVTRI